MINIYLEDGTMTDNLDVKKLLTDYLKELHLPTIRACYEELARMAEANTLSYEQFLFEVIEKEVEIRRTNRFVRLLKESKLPLEKSLENFDQKRLPQKVRLQLKNLLEGYFLDNTENVLVFGNPGTGKTHLLCAIAQELISKDYRLYFSTCSLFVQDLLKAKSELRLSRFLKKLSKYKGIIIDDIGYVQQNREEMEVLFTFLAEKYERASVLLTSNLPFSKWELIFKDPMTTAAAIDKLIHHSIIIELDIPSFRMEKAIEKTQNNS